MKIAALFVVALFAATGEASRCTLFNGQSLMQFGGRSLAIKHECKFNMVYQTCGKYHVTLTPGLEYVYPTYIVSTIWLGVKDTETGRFWGGRTTNKIIAKYIIAAYKKEAADSWNYKDGDATFSDIFTVTSTTQDVTITAKDESFAITVSPYDFDGDGNKDSSIVFDCNASNGLTPFPKQYCGSSNGDEIKDVTRAMFGDPSLLDYSLPYLTFNDTSIAQENPYCIDATTTFTETCKDHIARRNAIALCEPIIQSTGHTKCVRKQACSVMEIFVACLKYVCSDYTDKAACSTLGSGIDRCREVRGVNRWGLAGVTKRMKDSDCYKDLLTLEDNPYYKYNAA